MNTRKTLLLIVALVAIAAPSRAQLANDVSVWVVQPSIRGRNTIEGTPFAVRQEGRAGYGVGYRRQRNRWISVEADVMRFYSRTSLRQQGTRVASLGELSLTPMSVMSQFHVCSSCRSDLWLGLGATYVLAGNLTSRDLDNLGIGTVSVGNRVAGIGAVGVDVPMGASVSLAMNARYAPLTLEGRIQGDAEASKIKLNPMMVSAGVRIRF